MKDFYDTTNPETVPGAYSLFFPQLSACSKAVEGNYTLYRKISGDDKVVICLRNNGKYVWKFLDGKRYI